MSLSSSPALQSTPMYILKKLIMWSRVVIEYIANVLVERDVSTYGAKPMGNQSGNFRGSSD